MSLSNLSNDKMLTFENLTSSYTKLYKKDMVLVNLLGKTLEITVILKLLILYFFLRPISFRTMFNDFNLPSFRNLR